MVLCLVYRAVSTLARSNQGLCSSCSLRDNMILILAGFIFQFSIQILVFEEITSKYFFYHITFYLLFKVFSFFVTLSKTSYEFTC